MTGVACFVDTHATVAAFVAENVTASPLLASAVSYFFMLSAFYGLIACTWHLLAHVRAVLGMLLPGGGNVKRYGKWAVVTGATDGIGKGYAFELARKGMNVVLISRTQSKLDKVAAELQAKHPCETRTIAIDFSDFNTAKQDTVRAALADLDVGVLVNNVGLSYSRPYFYLEAGRDYTDTLIEVNLNSMTRMTYLVLPGMVERKRGAIVNVSSGAGTLPQPLQAVYGGTKNFVNSYSESMDLEYRSKGVRISSHAPMFVVSNLSKIRRASLTVPTPTTYARASVAKIGNGQTYCLPYWAHRVQLCIFNMMPRWVMQRIVTNMHVGIRKKALRKEARKAAEAAKSK